MLLLLILGMNRMSQKSGPGISWKI